MDFALLAKDGSQLNHIFSWKFCTTKASHAGGAKASYRAVTFWRNADTDSAMPWRVGGETNQALGGEVSHA